MVPQGVGDLVDHQVGRDETHVPVQVALSKQEGSVGVRFREIPLRCDGCVYDGRRRSRHRRISFVLSYSLGAISFRYSSMRRAAARARRRSIGVRSLSSSSSLRRIASRRTSDQLMSRIRAIPFRGGVDLEAHDLHDPMILLVLLKDYQTSCPPSLSLEEMRGGRQTDRRPGECSYRLGPCERPMGSRGHAWSDFSFVVSSGYRERVLTSLAPKPKVPRQLAEETDLRIVHVSRALRELSDRGLVECLTPEVKARGRLYGLTPDGAALLAELNGSRRYVTPTVRESHKEGFVPKIRGSSVLRFLEYMKRTRGRA